MWLRTLDHVPAEFFTSCHPNLPWFASMVFSHDTSPSNRFPTALQLLNAASTCTLSETLFNNTFLRTHAPFRSFTFLLNVGTESLKTNVRVCVCVHPWAKGFPPPPPSPVFHKLSLAGEWCAVFNSPLNEDTPRTAVISGRDAFWTYLR